MGEVAELARRAFALGYADYFPLVGLAPSRRVQAACVSCQESAAAIRDPRLVGFIVEAGRTEGKRSAREVAHRKLYEFHSDQLGAAWLAILSRLDHDVLAASLIETAQHHDGADSTPVARRRAVAGIASAAIAAQIRPDDRLTLDTMNAAGWAHATAYGSGEAQSTPARGGPPDAAKVAAAAAIALKAVAPGQANAVAAGWTDMELQTLAMGAALAAGDGAALGDAARKVTASLVDSGRATAAYANQLHQAVTNAYVAQSVAANPEVLFDWVTDGDPCDNCVPSGTFIGATSPRRSFQRYWVGELVELETRSGKRTAVTPNHPILTDRGWVAADLLNEGDNVVCASLGERVFGIPPDGEDVEPTIEQVLDAASEQMVTATVRVPSSRADFHGDGSDGQVTVVRAYGELREGFIPAVTQPLSQKNLVGVPQPGFLPSQGSGAQLVERPSTGCGSSVSGFDPSLALIGSGVVPEVTQHLPGTSTDGRVLSRSLLRGHSVPPELGRVAPAAEIDSVAPEEFGDRTPRHLLVAADLSGTFAALVAGDDQVDHGRLPFDGLGQEAPPLLGAGIGDREPTRFTSATSLNSSVAQVLGDGVSLDAVRAAERLATLARSITLDDVVRLRRLPYRGHVYNLSTDEGFFTANGIVTHNCEDNEMNGPYTADNVPECPDHPNCRCDLEATAYAESSVFANA